MIAAAYTFLYVCVTVCLYVTDTFSFCVLMFILCAYVAVVPPVSHIYSHLFSKLLHISTVVIVYV